MTQKFTKNNLIRETPFSLPNVLLLWLWLRIPELSAWEQHANCRVFCVSVVKRLIEIRSPYRSSGCQRVKSRDRDT